MANGLNLKRVTSVCLEYEEALKLYATSFPYNEQRERKSQNEILSNKEYRFDIIYDESEFVGIILSWETNDFLYVEHLCIMPEKRGNGYGSKVLALIKNGKKVILEIDPLTSNVAVKRLDFYIRNGFLQNDFSHVHPPYHKGVDGHNLIVMSYPSMLTDKEYEKFNKYLSCTVMKNAY